MFSHRNKCRSLGRIFSVRGFALFYFQLSFPLFHFDLILKQTFIAKLLTILRTIFYLRYVIPRLNIFRYKNIISVSHVLRQLKWIVLLSPPLVYKKNGFNIQEILNSTYFYLISR